MSYSAVGYVFLHYYSALMNIQSLFDIKTSFEFETMALEVFQFQYQNNKVYKEFCTHLGTIPSEVNSLEDIPFLPIEFFKSKKVICDNQDIEAVFSSSGTTGSITSKHYVTSLNLYQKSYLKGFEAFYRDITEYCILALLPSYLERKGSSLIYMITDLIQKSGHTDSGFYLDDLASLHSKLQLLEDAGQKTLLIGVSFALLDFVENHPIKLQNTIIMETGGMKGRRKEMIRAELHEILSTGFGVENIHSEYGMTELLSQAYSKGKGIFKTPPWMKAMVRDTEDPLSLLKTEKTGGLNVIDLANVHSCSFIATQDLAKCQIDGSFEILGRFDNSDIRGCNLMVI